MDTTLALPLLMAASAYAQATDFMELVKTATPEEVQAAIDDGADIDAPDDIGMTPLMYAAWYNQNPEVIIVLLKAGADIEAQDDTGMTPLIMAAFRNHNPEVVTTLLKAGANAKTKDYWERTAFDDAQKNEYLKGTEAYRHQAKVNNRCT